MRRQELESAIASLTAVALAESIAVFSERVRLE